MDFLNKETENLLQECIDNSSNFSDVLAEKLKSLSSPEYDRLKERIKMLVDKGYFSNLQWADGVPWKGTISEKGYDYFHKKDVFIRAKLRQQPHFNLLDSATEKFLAVLVNSNKDQITIQGDSKQARLVEHLEKQGYIRVRRNGLNYTLDGSFWGVISVTQSGKTYFSDKEELIEEILLSQDVSEDLSDTYKSNAQKTASTKVPKEVSDSIVNIPKSTTQKTASKKVLQEVADDKHIIFSGILGFDCGEVESYSGQDKQKQDKGYIVRNGIPTLRGFAKMSDIAKASKAKYEYQRDKNQFHIGEITKFLDHCKAEAKFLPEVVLSVNDPKTAQLKRYSHKAFSNLSETAQGAINNMEYYTLEVEEGTLSRVDGNHRLEAGIDKDYYIPFSIIVWGINQDSSENLLLNNESENNTESEAFLFYILNNTAKRLEAEENFKGLVQSKNWGQDELKIINKHLPILKHFETNYAHNSLLDKGLLNAPLSQICEILTEIDVSDLNSDKFDAIFIDTAKMLSSSELFKYCRKEFSKILFQLAFYARYKNETLENTISKLKYIDNWLEKYKYTGETFSKASKLFDVADKFISSFPKHIFMAMEYKSPQTVDDYNGALTRAGSRLNKMSGSIAVEAWSIMTGKGKSFNITSDIYHKLDKCDIFIADITESNPNVMYELGIAYDKRKPIILVVEKSNETEEIKVPSDIISEYYYPFYGMTELENLFVTHIKEILISDYDAVFLNNEEKHE